MRIRRSFPIVLAVVVIAAAVTLAVQLRKHAPPEAARLLPGADAFFYLDLNLARRANSGKELPPVSHDPEYERFIQQTGFVFERDLDQAAFAVHYPAKWLGGGTGGSSPDVRFSEVLGGKFHSERLTSYLRQIAQSVENYNSVDIFSILIQGRSLRVAVLGADSVAASNHDDPAVIRGIVDRSKRLASPFGGPALLRQYYKHIQFGSLAWAVARFDPSAPWGEGWKQIFAKPATLVISASFLSPLHLSTKSIHLRAEAFAPSAEDAGAIADKVNVFLAISHAAEMSVGSNGTDPDVKALFDSFKVAQEGDRAVLTAAMPFAFLHKVFSGSAPDLVEPTSAVPANDKTALQPETDVKAQIQDLLTKLRKEPRSASLHNQLAVVYGTSGNFTGFETEIHAAMKLEPRNPINFSQASFIYGLAGQKDKEGLMLQKAMSLDPKNPVFRFQRARLLEATGRSEEAHRDYLDARRLLAEAEERGRVASRVQQSRVEGGTYYDSFNNAYSVENLPAGIERGLERTSTQH